MKYDVCFRHNTLNQDQWVTVDVENRRDVVDKARTHVDNYHWHHYGTRESTPQKDP